MHAEKPGPLSKDLSRSMNGRDDGDLDKRCDQVLCLEGRWVAKAVHVRGQSSEEQSY